MKRQMYNKMGMNPHNKKWDKVGEALLLEEEADILNQDLGKAGIKYELAESKKATTKK